MFPRLAGTRPALALKASLRYQAQLRSAVPASAMASIRHQSSSSSSRDNENQDSDKVDPVQSTAPHVNASFELHRIDLAHGSFFAMHRPLLGITNGPMFGNTSTNNTASAGNDTEQSTLNTTTDILTPSGNGSGVQNTTAMNEGDFEADPVDDLSLYFSTLHPFSQAQALGMDTSTFQMGPMSPTAVAWASYPPSFSEPDQIVDDFFDLADTKLQEGMTSRLTTEPMMEEEEALSTSASTSASTSTSLLSEDNGVIGTTLLALGPQLSQASKMYLTSVLRKRRLKMKKHKYNKLRKRTRALRKKLGK